MAALLSSPSPAGLVSGLLSQGGVLRGLPGAPGWGTGPAPPVSSVRTVSDAVGPVQSWTPTQLPTSRPSAHQHVILFDLIHYLESSYPWCFICLPLPV